ncbi:hypothetical protein K493DRAFT_295229 [Basidiobolus meristosporus CBS 931.73]|uniref:Uncharacterized protein n=1 Tax=Basidiobolus meristosporus CBS 931.73 TaxID=1314790 RepID=A0A1Y1ZCV4_9FUNG|nr:hypothetical protein K493DRAFT_295229 [Basidiobolus meristosporus CBS 931.73]|eukprot:ORY07994.1 hypothetical protein K493DRAFT_295229 [Basidiobolus meristosporus CBS 931.73]
MSFISFRVEKAKGNNITHAVDIIDVLTNEVLYRKEPSGMMKEMDSLHLVTTNNEIPLWEANPVRRSTEIRLDSHRYKSQVVFDNSNQRPTWFYFVWKNITFTWERSQAQYLCFAPGERLIAKVDLSTKMISVLENVEKFAPGTESLLILVSLKVLSRGKKPLGEIFRPVASLFARKKGTRSVAEGYYDYSATYNGEYRPSSFEKQMIARTRTA